MSNYSQLKTAINAVITANGQNEITGTILNQILTAMVNSLGAGYHCMGVATPSTNPNSPDQNVFYFATEAGTYVNFGGIILQNGISVLLWNGSWTSQTWFTIDTEPTSGSTNLVMSKGVYEMITGLELADYAGSALQPTEKDIVLRYNLGTEEEPDYITIASLVLSQADDTHAGLLPAKSEWDDEPTAESKNLVKSGGVANCINELYPAYIEWTDGKYFQPNGEDIVTDNFNIRCISNLLYCENAGTVEISCETNNSGVAAVYFYDKDFIWIDYLSNIGADCTAIQIDIPSDAVYMRISSFVSRKGDSYVKLPKRLFYKNINKKALHYYSPEKYDIIDYLSLVSIYNNTSFRDGKPYRTSGTASFNSTSFAILDKSKPIYTNCNGNCWASFFDINKNFISTASFYFNSPLTTQDYPNDAYYVAFTYYKMETWMGVEPCIITKELTLTKYVGYYFATPNIIKKKGIRPIVNVYLNDTPVQILNKLATAVLTEDCDVYFESGDYDLTGAFDYMYNQGKTSNYVEIPIGGNCRYFFNGSKIIANVDNLATNVYTCDINVFSNRDVDNKSFELRDLYMDVKGFIYGIHDEGIDEQASYSTIYRNINIKYTDSDRKKSDIRKCIGGGTGRFCNVLIENCSFEMVTDIQTPKEVTYHGYMYEVTSSKFNLKCINSYLKHGLHVHSLADNQTALITYSGNSANDNDVATEIPNVLVVNSWNNNTHN